MATSGAGAAVELREVSRVDPATEERVLGCWAGAGTLTVPDGAGSDLQVAWEVTTVTFG